MPMLEAIVEDLLAAVSPEDLAADLGLPEESGDIQDQLIDYFLSSGVVDVPKLRETCITYLGRAGIQRILRRRSISFDISSPLPELVGKWFEFHEVEIVRPAVRPHELACTVAELAKQIGTTPDKFESVDLLIGRFRLLLRYLGLYYALQPANGEDFRRMLEGCGSPAAAADPAAAIEQFTFPQLCCCLRINKPLKAEPYNAVSSKTISISNEVVNRALEHLGAMTSADQNGIPPAKAVCDETVLLLRQWHSSDSDSIIPKGAVIVESTQAAFGTRGVCYDEFNRRFAVSGVRTVMQVGDNVLMAAASAEEVRAPKLRPVPRSEAWKTPSATSCGLPESASRSMPNTRVANRVFISYSHEDRDWAQRVKKHLKALEDKQIIEIWDDSQLRPGDQWNSSIHTALANCGIAILVITTAFLNSDYIRKDELPELLKAAAQGSVRIVPVIVKHTYLEIWPELTSLQWLNDRTKPLDSLESSDCDRVLVELSDRVRSFCETRIAS